MLTVINSKHFVLHLLAARKLDQDVPVSQLKTLAKKFHPMDEQTLLEEWSSFREHLTTGMLKVKDFFKS